MKIIKCLLILSLFSCFLDGASAETEKPNIVLIMADDMGYECVGANGGAPYKTPHLDRLAAEGMRFTHCHSQPICTPSRVQLMTGRYNSKNYLRFGLLDPEAKTFGHMMREAGYATCIVGKWQLKGGFEGPTRFGFDEYCLWQLTRRPNRYPNPGLEVNGKEVDYKNGEYGPDLVSDHGCDFIARKKDQPFFLYYPMILPHWPFEPTPDSPDWDPTARREDKAEKGANTTSARHFADMVAYTDKMVGKIVAAVEKHGLRNKTLVLFTGDNGTMTGMKSLLHGNPYIGGKGLTRDNGTHVPLIASWPGHIQAGKVCEDLIDFSDMLPTIAAATSASLPTGVKLDGRSFLPQLLGKAGSPRDWIYCWYFRNGKAIKPGGFKGGELARTKQYKLYHDGRFFDVINDHQEASPLAQDSLTAEQKKIQTMLRQVIDTHTRAGFYETLKAPKVKKKKNPQGKRL